MFTKEEKNLERYIDVHIVMAPLSGEKWGQYFEKMIGLVLDSNKDKIDQDDISGFNEHLAVLYEFLEPVLDTPRKIKAMCRHLDEKLKTPASTIYIVDLVFLSSIQTFNPRLFQWISNNRKSLVDISSASHERWAIMDRSSKEGIKRDEVSKLRLKDFGASENEIEIVHQIFFGSQKLDQTTSEKVINERSVRKNQYFLNYFTRDRLPIVGTVIGKKELFALIEDNSASIDDIYKFVKNDWLLSEERPDLREIILGNLRAWIKDLPQPKSYRLLIALGRLGWIIPDDGFIFHPKSYASFSTWDFIEEKTVSQEEFFHFVIKIINEPISHKFYTALIFYLFTTDPSRNKNRFKDATDEIRKVAESFDNRCKMICYVDYDGRSETVRNILDRDVSDNPFDLLYRWAQVQSGRNHEKYLMQLISQKPDTLKPLVDYLRSQPQEGIEVVISKEKWKSIFESKDKYQSLNDKDLDFISSLVFGKHKRGWES